MYLPSSHNAAILLLVLSFLLLGSWANTLKLAGERWRFELYYFDFAIGAILCALLAAYTLGTLGSELSFNDRIVIAGLRSQAIGIGSGFIFNLGNMLLLAAVSLIGMAASFPLVFSVAFIIAALTPLQNVNYVLLGTGMAGLIASAVCAGISQKEPVQKASFKRQPSARFVKKSTKSVIVGVFAGIFIGVSYPVGESAFWGDLGLGAYAGLLMFCIGIVISTTIFGLFLMNMAIEGPRLNFGAYLRGTPRQHMLGIVGGFLLAGGWLAALLARSVPDAVAPSFSEVAFWTRAFVLLAILWGLFLWKEKAPTGNKGILLPVAGALFLAGIAALALRFPGVS